MAKRKKKILFSETPKPKKSCQNMCDYPSCTLPGCLMEYCKDLKQRVEVKEKII